MRLIVTVMTVLFVTACSSMPTAPEPAPVVKANPVAVVSLPPVKSKDVLAAERLVAAWQILGLKPEAKYEQLPGKPADRIEWKKLGVALPGDVAQFDGVMRAVGQFAATAGKPVNVVLYAANNKQDKQMTAALKQGAIDSGGRNSVKVDHNISPSLQAKVEILVREE